MCRFCPKVQGYTWQLVSDNINRQRQFDIFVIAKTLLGLVRTHARVPTMFSTHETKSWDVPSLTLPGYVCCGSKSGFATLLVSKQICTIKRSWRHEERRTANLFWSALVMDVYAPDSSKDMELYEACVSSILRILREGRRCKTVLHHWRPQRVAGDEMYGPLCWQRYDHDPGRYKKIMWYSIMKEFNCKVSSTWSNDDRTKDAAFTHRKHGDGEHGKVSQLDSIIGPAERLDDCFICNEGKLWNSWDHYPIYARIQEGRDTEQFFRKRNRVGTNEESHGD